MSKSKEPDAGSIITKSMVGEMSSLGFLLEGKGFLEYLKATSNGQVLLKDVGLHVGFSGISYGTPEQSSMLLGGSVGLVGKVLFKRMGDEAFNERVANKGAAVGIDPTDTKKIAELVNKEFISYMKALIKDPAVRKEINHEFKEFYNGLIDKGFLPNADKEKLKEKIKDMSEQEMSQFLDKANPLLGKIFLGITKGQNEYQKQKDKYDGKESASVDEPKQNQLGRVVEVAEAKMPDASIRNNTPQNNQRSIT